MDTTLIVLGIALVAAAVVGGGLSIAGNTFAQIQSRARQVMLAAVGLVAVGLGVWLIRAGASEDPSKAGGGGSSTSTTPDTFGPGTTLTFPTRPPHGETTLSVSPQSGPVGTIVTIAGSGFDGGETVELRFDTRILGRVTADARGAFSGFRVGVPETPFKGQHSFLATGKQSIRTAEEPFEVT